MKKIFPIIYFTFLAVYSNAQSLELNPGGLSNLKIGDNHSIFSPAAPASNLFIYNRNFENASIRLVDSSLSGKINISSIFSRGDSGLVLRNHSLNPISLHQNYDFKDGLMISPFGKVSIGQEFGGLNLSEKHYGKLHIKGIGDSALNIANELPALSSTFVLAENLSTNQYQKAGLISTTDGSSSVDNSNMNVGIIGLNSINSLSLSSGIGVKALSQNYSEGSSYGLFSKSQNDSTGSSFGLFSESKSKLGATYGIFSQASSKSILYGIFSNLQIEPLSISPAYSFYSKIDGASNQAAIYGYYADIKRTSGTGATFGSYMDVNAPFSSSVYGSFNRVSSTDGSAFGSFSSVTGSGSNFAVYGFVNGGNQNIAIYGSTSEVTQPMDYAGYFDGRVHVNGVLSKSSGTFKIDHPQDPENKYLNHSFVESPEMLNIYSGNTKTDNNGLVLVELPKYFESLNKDFRYQLTVIGSFSQAIILEKIKDNKFKIKTSEPNTEVSWMIMGNRKDPFALKNPIIVEEIKSAEEKGKYLNPDLYGKSLEKSLIKRHQ